MKSAATQEPVARSWKRSLASGSAQLFGATLASNAGFFVAVVILTRGLSPAERGTVAFVIVSALAVAVVCGLGLGDAATVFASTRPESRPRVLTNLLLALTLTSVAGAVAVFLVYRGLGAVRLDGLTTPEVLLLGVGVVATALFEAVQRVPDRVQPFSPPGPGPGRVALGLRRAAARRLAHERSERRRGDHLLGRVLRSRSTDPDRARRPVRRPGPA